MQQEKDKEDAEAGAAKGAATEALPNNNKTPPQKNKELETSQLESPLLIGNAAAADADAEAAEKAAAAKAPVPESVPENAAQAAAKASVSKKRDKTTSASASTKSAPLLTQNTAAAAVTAAAAAATAEAENPRNRKEAPTQFSKDENMLARLIKKLEYPQMKDILYMTLFQYHKGVFFSTTEEPSTRAQADTSSALPSSPLLLSLPS